MDINKLRNLLKKSGVSKQLYNLDGKGRDDERLCLVYSEGKWNVYYSERGIKTTNLFFETESEACEYIFNALTDDILQENFKVNLIEINYKGVLCRLGSYRVNGEPKPTLYYISSPDSETMYQAGFNEIHYGLWGKILTDEEYKEIIKREEERGNMTIEYLKHARNIFKINI